MLKPLQPWTPLLRLHMKKITKVKRKSYRSGDGWCFIIHVGVKSWKPPEHSTAGSNHGIYSMRSKQLLKKYNRKDDDSFKKYLLNAYNMPSTILDTETVNKKTLLSLSLFSSVYAKGELMQQEKK